MVASMAVWLLLVPIVTAQINSNWVAASFTTQTGTPFSTGQQPQFGSAYVPIVGFTCSGTDCGTKAVSGTLLLASTNSPLLIDSTTANLTDTISSNVLTTTYCPLGSVAVWIQCSGTNCGSVQLQCMRPTTSDNVWRTVNNGTRITVGPFGSPNTAACPAATALCGMSCLSNGCGSISLQCCPLEMRVCRTGYAYDPSFTCQGVQCATQPNPPNGVISSTNFNSYPSTSTLSCANGYQVSGNKTRTCFTNTTWSGVPPTCVGITCTTLPSVVNGGFSLSNNYTYPTTASFTCSAGYVVSQDSRTCFYDGSWTGSPVTCTGVQCDALQPPDSGSITVTNDYAYPATATLVCDPGYNISGPASTTCGSDGHWSGALGACVGIVCNALPTSPRYSIQLLSVRYPSTAFITCAIGCVGATQVLTCNTDGTWTGTIPDCPYISCGLPTDPGGNYCNNTAANICTGFQSPTNLTFRPAPTPATATWTCMEGYTQYGVNQAVQCRSNGVWNSSTVYCHAVYCESLPNIATTSLTISNAQWYPSVAVYSCLSGYISNSTTLVCERNRTWTGDGTLTCAGRLCDVIPFWTPTCNCRSDTTNGGHYPSTTYFQCLDGFQRDTGNNYRQCTIYGNWTNTNLQCIGVQCVALSCTPIACNVTYNNSQRYPSTATVQCPAGYFASPSATTNCLADGRWNDQITCIGVTCDAIPNVTNGVRLWSNNRQYPSVASTLCQAGYKLVGGTQTVSCNTNGTWNGAFASCVGVPCLQDPFVVGGVQTYTSQNNFTYPDMVTAQCLPGYTIAESHFNCSTFGVYCCGPFNCTGINCTAVPSNSYYTYLYNSSILQFPVTVTYTCIPDYYTNMTTFGECLPTANFSIPPPVCLRFAIDMLYVNGVAADYPPNSTNTTKLAMATSYGGGDILTITGSFGNTQPVITYGPTVLIRFPCTLLTNTASTLTCRMSASYGGRCRVYLAYAASEVGNLTIMSPLTLHVSHPKAVVNSHSLVMFNAPPPQFGYSWPLMASSTKGGDVIYFNGSFFSNWTCCVKVFYGPALDDMSRECIVNNVTDHEIVCTTSAGEQGPHFFQITVYDVASDMSPEGYKYPIGPVVYGVEGCTTIVRDNVSEATNCPTAGGVKITINGNYFVDNGTTVAPAYMIGSSFGVATNYSNTTIVLTLPVGIGITSVIVASASGQSAAKSLITYAAPSFTALSGCLCTDAQQPCYPTGCNRTGESLTIYGSNFGKSSASVFLVGVGTCANPVHDPSTPHSKLTCQLPPGYALHQPIAMLQLGGFLSFAASPIDVSYLQCAPGSYQNGSSTVCALCRPGQFSALSGQTVCQECSYGEFSNTTGAKKCFQAAEGTYVPMRSSQNSLQCLPGTYSLTPGASVCKDCAPGYFANSLGTSSCQQCIAGSSQASSGKDVCPSCQPGSFATSPASLQCVVCSAGTIAPSPGATSCSPCPIARYSVNTTACVPCEAGKYINVKGASSCVQCDEGFFAAIPESDICDSCPLGTFQPSKQGTSCQTCPAGTFANVRGASACFNCEAGSFANASGLALCFDCPPGSYAERAGLAACVPCPAGTYSPNSRGSQCLPCPAGTFQSATGASICTDCPAGTFAQDLAQKFCTNCTAGRFAQISRSTSCLACPKGTAIPVAGSVGCDPCDRGYFADKNGQTLCGACDVGRYSVMFRSTSCVDCSLGRYQNATGLTDCINCEPGYFADSQGASRCRACDPGSFTGGVGYAACQPCDPGTAIAFSAATVCSDCLPGHFTQFPHSITCDACPRGFYQAYLRGSTCSPCEAGSSSNQPYANQTGAVVCEPCDPGMYASFPGSYTCSLCEQGKYADQFHSSSCSFCMEGTANNQTGQLACSDCPAGAFAETQGSSECQLCLSGKFTDVVRTVRCRLCQPGTAVNMSGATVCDDCLPGQFAANPGSLACDGCPKGFYSAVPRTSLCSKCPKGTAANVTGLVECISCEVGTYSNLFGSLECLFCQAGTFADVIRAISCGDCPPGRFNSYPGASTCNLCPRGKYNSRQGSGSCLLCLRGSIAPEQGAAVCEDCKPGQYGLSDGESSCENCVAGRSQKREGASGCDICEAGTYSDAGREVCATCGAGSAMPFKGAVRCQLCDINGRSANPPLDCVCAANYFAPTRPSNSSLNEILGCQGCPKGLDCALPGNTFETLSVLPGWWRSDTSSLDMYKCVLPTHCLGGRNSTCGPNRWGLVCSLCLEGYAAGGAGRTGECQKCKERSNSLVQAIFFCLLLFLGLGVLYYLVLRSQRKNVARFIASTKGETASMSVTEEEYNPMESYDSWDSPTPRAKRKSTTTVRSPKSVSLKRSVSASKLSHDSIVSSVGELDKKASLHEAEEERIAQKRLDKKRRAGVTGKLRIILSMLQIGTTLVSSLNIPWPTLFRNFLDALNFVNLDFVPWQSVGCVAHISYFTKLFMITAIPIVAFLSLIFFFMLPMWIWDRRKQTDYNDYCARRDVSQAKLWRLMLFTVFLVYPYVSSSIFRMYVCYYLEGNYYMKMDFEVKCYQDEWNSMIWPSVGMMLLYPFGIPFVTFVLLYRARNMLDEPKSRFQLGFLYESYTRVAWFWELVVMANKLFLTSFVGFFPDVMQMPAALIWLFFYLGTSLLRQPFVYKSDDRLDLFACSLLMLLCLCGHVLNTSPTLDYTTDTLLSIVLILLFIVLFLIFNFMAVRLIVRKSRVFIMKRVAQYRRDRRNSASRQSRLSVNRSATGLDPLDLQAEPEPLNTSRSL